MRSFSGSIPTLTSEDSTSWRRLGNVHWGPFLVAVILTGIGIATIQSATAELGGGYAARQSLWLLLGVLACAACFAVDYHALVDAAPMLYGLALVLLVAVLFVGTEAGGARSWLQLGPLRAQPSELAKLVTALALARRLSGIQRSSLTLRQILEAATLVAIPMVLVAAESDLGGAVMFLPMLVGVLLVAGIDRRHLVVFGLIGILAAGGLWTYAMKPYQRERIVSFKNRDDPLGAGYQARQAKIAVGSGQWLGRGWGQGTQSQLRFLPERHTDFVMAVYAEEWGFAGVALVLGLYGLYLHGAATIAIRGRDRAGVLLVVALVSVLGFHVLYNTAMVVGLLPITGIPLPFLSYGGSFLLTSFAATGLLLNVDLRRYVNR